MGEQFVAEGRKHYKPLVTLPRATGKDEYGSPREPVVTIDVRFGKRTAGCVICNKPITPNATRIEINVLLREPVAVPGGRQRTHERFFAHPGCLTERVRPEVIRSRMDCYDCGAEPAQHEDLALASGLVYWEHRCFTVSKFAAAPLCSTCIRKPRWKMCEACVVYFPHWMVSEAAESKDSVPVAHMEQYYDLAIREHQNLCDFCAQRLGVSTVATAATEKENFEKLRAEIAAHGVWDAGTD